MLKKFVLLTHPTLARRDAPFPEVRSRIVQIPTYPTREKSCSDSSGRVGENRYASALHSLRPCWTNFLSILRECFPVVPHVRTLEVLAYQNSCSAAC